MAAVSDSMQLNDDDIGSAVQPDQEQQDRGEPSRAPRPPTAADPPLPTIDESQHGTADPSPPASTRSGSGALSSGGVSSEFAFDSLDVPDVVETRPDAGVAPVGTVVARQTTEAGLEVITVVLTGEERELKDSAKEMHEQSKEKVGGPDEATHRHAAGIPGQVSALANVLQPG